MKNLSKNLRQLGNHLAKTEKKISAAGEKTKKKLEASINKSKEVAKTRQESFKANVKEKEATAALQWGELQDNYNQKIQQIKNKIETQEETRDSIRAVHRAVDAKAYAEAAVSFAMLAIDEAEVAVLEAFDAQVYAESLA